MCRDFREIHACASTMSTCLWWVRIECSLHADSSTSYIGKAWHVTLVSLLFDIYPLFCRVECVLFQMDKKRKRQLLQTREDAIAQLYQGTALCVCVNTSLADHCMLFRVRVDQRDQQMVSIWTDLWETAEGDGCREGWVSLLKRCELINVAHSDLSKVNSTWNREGQVNTFLHWLQGHGVETSNFEICPFGNYGFGLKATRDLQVNDIWHSLRIFLTWMLGEWVFSHRSVVGDYHHRYRHGVFIIR